MAGTDTIQGDAILEFFVDGTASLHTTVSGETGLAYVTKGGYKQYQGDYIVVPDVEEQVLETADKLMLDDVTIRQIPTYTVSNAAGGETFYIASEVEVI